MPRAFLITRRRYNGTEEFEEPVRDCSPERGVRVAEYGGGQPTSDGVSDCGSETSSECPEELYNLTKLAEVSLAAAAGTLIHPSKLMYRRSESPRCAIEKYDLFDASNQQRSYEKNEEYQRRTTEEQLLQEKTRLFFERIEAERKILDRRSPSTDAETPRISYAVRKGSPLPHGDPKTTCTNYHNDSKTVVNDAPLQKPPSTPVEPSKPEESEDHECPDCGKKYSTSSNLARHRQTHRSLGDKKARRCPHCDKVYVSMPAYSMHVRTHNQGCKCHYCGKCFSRPWLLQGHIRTHTGEKPFKCTICNKAFADKSNLRAHIQTHSNTKPHICGRCGKAFALKSYLYKHEESSCMRAHHRASSEKRETERCSPIPSRISAPVTASQTSVIVPRLGFARSTSVGNGSEPLTSAFSGIQHTKTSQPASISPMTLGTASENLLKRQYSERNPENQAQNYTRQAERIHSSVSDSEIHSAKRRPDTPVIRGSDYMSQMVIRTSVISPNPEHLGRLSSANKKSPFDFSTSRSSAFSRPSMTLNLAIA